MLISRRGDLDKEVTHQYEPSCKAVPRRTFWNDGDSTPRTSFPLRPISRSRNIPTLRYEKKEWGNPKKEVAKPQTCGNLRNELHESAGAGAIRIFLANVKTECRKL